MILLFFSKGMETKQSMMKIQTRMRVKRVILMKKVVQTTKRSIIMNLFIVRG